MEEMNVLKYARSVALRLQRFAKAYAVQLLMLIVLMPTLVVSFDNHMINGQSTLNYFVGYETGFGGRKLIGTICHYLFPDAVAKRDVFTLIWGANIVVVLAFCWFVGGVIPRLRQSEWSVLLVVVAYMAGPFSIISWIATHASVWMMETYMVMLTLLWLIGWLRWRRRWWYWPATLLVPIICLLIHHTYCCLIFPMMVALFVYDSFDNEMGRIRVNWLRAVPYGVVCLIELGLFVAVWKYSTMNLPIEELTEIVKRRDVSDVAHFTFSDVRDDIWLYYYATNGENVATNSELFPYRWVELFFSVLLLSPLLVFFDRPIYRAAKQARKYSDEWWRYVLSLVAEHLITLPVFFFATDYSRWFYCYIFTQFVLLMTMVAVGDKSVRNGIDEQYAWCKRHWIASLFLFAYIAFALHPNAIDLDGLREAIWARRLMTGTAF